MFLRDCAEYRVFEIESPQYLHAFFDMGLQQFLFFVRQLVTFGQQFARQRDLADIGEHRGLHEVAQAFLIEPHLVADGAAQFGQPCGMKSGIRVVQVDDVDQRGDQLVEHLLFTRGGPALLLLVNHHRQQLFGLLDTGAVLAPRI